MTTKTRNKQESNGSDVKGSGMSNVYYAKDFERTFFSGISGVFPDDFKFVGSVKTPMLNEIWELYNDYGLEAPLTKGEVERSMCIGDVVESSNGIWILSNDEGWMRFEKGECVVIDSRKADWRWA